MLLTASDHPFPKSPHALSVYLTISFLLKVSNDPPFQIYFGSTQSYSGQRLQGHRSTICFPIMYSQIHRTVSPYSGLSHPHFSLNLLGVRHLETLAFETVLHSSQEPCFRVYTTNEDRPRSFGKVLPWVDMHSTQPLYRSAPY